MQRRKLSRRAILLDTISLDHEVTMIRKYSLKIAALCGIFLLGGAAPAEALWPFCNWFGGYQAGSSYGYGTYTSHYGPTAAYGYNPFAPLVPNPYCGGCQTANYGFGFGVGSSPCGPAGCATGNCSLATTNQRLTPTPDSPPPSTYDREDVPMDDPNFQRSSPDNEDGFPGLDRDSYKVPMKVDETNGITLPMDKTPPVEVQEEDENGDSRGLEAPKPQSNTVPNLIDPRNSARLEEFQKLEHEITWRNESSLIRSRPVVRTSRPLVVRRTVRTGATATEQPLLTRTITK